MLTKIIKGQLLVLLVLSTVICADAQDKILEKTLNSMGYRVIKPSSRALQEWEANDLKMDSKQVFAIKSVKKIPGSEDMYRRLAVTIEKYKNPQDASQRLKNIQATPPGPNSKLTAPEYALREGFMRGATMVYVISTDVYTYVADGSMHKFVGDLDKKLPLIR